MSYVYYIFLGGIYDFEVNKPEEMEQKVHYLEGMREKLSRNINTRSINLLDKEEEQYNDTLKKKRIVENDKKKILETIKHLDEKKKQTLLKAWKQVQFFFQEFVSYISNHIFKNYNFLYVYFYMLYYISFQFNLF